MKPSAACKDISDYHDIRRHLLNNQNVFNHLPPHNVSESISLNCQLVKDQIHTIRERYSSTTELCCGCCCQSPTDCSPARVSAAFFWLNIKIKDLTLCPVTLCPPVFSIIDPTAFRTPLPSVPSVTPCLRIRRSLIDVATHLQALPSYQDEATIRKAVRRASVVTERLQTHTPRSKSVCRQPMPRHRLLYFPTIACTATI